MIAVQPTPRDLHSPALAFCPSGKRLACGAFDSVLVWDVATGKLEQDTLARGLPINDQTEFAQDDFVAPRSMADLGLIGMAASSPALELHRCRTGLLARRLDLYGGRNQDKSDALLALQLPQAEATRALQQAVQRTDPSIFGRGTSVRIEVTGVEKADEQEKTRQSLVARLAEIGCTPSDKGTFTLSAAVETNDRSQGNSKSKEMRSTLHWSRERRRCGSKRAVLISRSLGPQKPAIAGPIPGPNHSISSRRQNSLRHCSSRAITGTAPRWVRWASRRSRWMGSAEIWPA